jgi:hypothetical protein
MRTECGILHAISTEVLAEILLSMEEPSAWSKNRLKILHRTLSLNSYLAQISRAFQEPLRCLTLEVKTWNLVTSFMHFHS